MRFLLQCYCYVCDCPATECTAWGDGWHADDHCHGHPGSAHFLNLKNQRKASARSSGGAGSSRAVARAPYSISKVTSDLIRALRAKHPARAPSQQHTSPGKAKVKPPPPPPCRLKRIPDPAKDPSMLLLVSAQPADLNLQAWQHPAEAEAFLLRDRATCSSST